jgi:hypothetical protein
MVSTPSASRLSIVICAPVIFAICALILSHPTHDYTGAGEKLKEMYAAEYFLDRIVQSPIFISLSEF